MSNQNIYLDLQNNQIEQRYKESLNLEGGAKKIADFLKRNSEEISAVMKGVVTGVGVTAAAAPGIQIVANNINKNPDDSKYKIKFPQPIDLSNKTDLIVMPQLERMDWFRLVRAIDDNNLQAMESIIKNARNIDEANNLGGYPTEDSPTPLVYAMQKHYFEGM